MRNALLIAGITAGTLWYAATVEFPAGHPMVAAPAVTDVPTDAWRRTVDGWERRTDWFVDNHYQPRASVLHPGLVASFQLLAALGALVAALPNPSATQES